MTHFHRALLLPLAIVAAAATASGESHATKTPGAIGIQIGYAIGAGSWQNHRYADVNQFGNDLVFVGDFEIGFNTPADRNAAAPSPFTTWSAAMIIAYTRLATSDWEDYVRDQGDYIESSAEIWHIDAVLRRRIVTTRYHLLRFEFGGGLALANSEETYQDLQYEYDFLQSTRGEIILGLVYDWRFRSFAGLTARTGFIWAGNGIKYADGEEMGITTFPLTVGIRFYL